MNTRVLAVTAVLALLGGLAGALGGSLIGLGVLLFVGGAPSWEIIRGVFTTAGAIGSGVGFVAGPVLSWTLLRRAPIWRAILEPALGAGLAASVAFPFDIHFFAVIGASLLGATLAALRLRRSVNRSAAAAPIS